MNTNIPARLIEPSVVTAISRKDSTLTVTYGDGTSDSLDMQDVGSAIAGQVSTIIANKLDTATAAFIPVNPTNLVDGALSITGAAAFLYVDALRKLTK